MSCTDVKKCVTSPESLQRMGSSVVHSEATVRGTWAPAELVELNIKPRVGISLTLQPFICQASLKVHTYMYICIPEPAVAAGPVCLSCISVLGLPFSPLAGLFSGVFSLAGLFYFSQVRRR